MMNRHDSGHFLIMGQDSQPNQVFQLNKDVITIGSMQENDIVIYDADVSPHHAILTRREGDWYLADLGSKIGTWINGKRITKEVILRQGSRINLGPNVILTAEGGDLRSTSDPKKGARKKLVAISIIGLALLLMILLASAAALVYF